ncbi:MAG: AAA family ATPase, partial [Acidimicrobiia bacterium]|nr:AAA family ATPase [Acidimicrobiia bacterium]
DHALVMRRMPSYRRLSHLLGTAEASALVRAVARRVAVLHADAPRPAGAATAASRATVRHNWQVNAHALGAIAGTGPLAPLNDHALAAAERYLDGRGPLFERRIAEGHAIDGHGDLLSDDIFCLDDGPRILDCLAFDDALRHGDALADIAFLAMDIERLASKELAARLLDWYAEFSGEHHPASLADHYIAYRAQVRAKVAALKSTQGDVAAAGLAADHLRRCVEHLDRARVRLVLVGGAPGTGKSTVAGALADQTGWTVLRTDELRKDLTGVGRAARAAAAPGQGIYTSAATEATYRLMFDRAAQLLESGESVVLDASWADGPRRAHARALAARLSADLVELRCDVAPDVADRRIAARARQGTDVSDADAAVAAHLRARFDAWPQAVTLDTAAPLADSVAEALRLADPAGSYSIGSAAQSPPDAVGRNG